MTRGSGERVCCHDRRALIVRFALVRSRRASSAASGRDLLMLTALERSSILRPHLAHGLRPTQKRNHRGIRMKAFFFLAALAVVGLVVTGAIKMQKTNDNTISIQIDKQRVQEDENRLIDEGRHLLDNAGSALHDAGETSRN